MKEKLKALAIHNRLLSKCIAVALYITGYQNIQKELETFVDAEKRKDRRYVRRLMLDIYFSELYYRISPGEYFLYRFEGKTDEERRAYIGDTEKDILCNQIGDAESRGILADKYECYNYFKDFYGRDVIKVSGKEDRAVFEEFLSKHKDFIVKPVDLSGGEGIYRMDAENMDACECFQKVLLGSPCVVEQYIEQTDDLAQFHPQSVNTIRVGTFNNNGEIKILFSIFRTGTGDAAVDNSCAGGLFASVNTADGKIQSGGYAKDGRVYRAHPDTGCVLDGFQIPNWQDLLGVVVKAARAYPQHNYICWDFALTNSGWIIVEANSRGEFTAYQTFFGGIRELFMNEFTQIQKAKKYVISRP